MNSRTITKILSDYNNGIVNFAEASFALVMLGLNSNEVTTLLQNSKISV